MGGRLRRARTSLHRLSKMVGRIDQQRDFANALSTILKGELSNSKQIFLLYGEGGMGKTTLIERFEAICEDFSKRYDIEIVHLNFEDHKGKIRSSIDIMDILVGKLKPRYTATFKDYERIWQMVSETREKVSNLKVRFTQMNNPQSAPDLIDIQIGSNPQGNLVGKDIKQSKDTVFVAPGGVYQKLASKDIPENEALKSLSTQLDQGKRDFEIWLRANLTSEEWRVYENPQRELSEAFVAGVIGILDQNPVCVFLLDTYELVGKEFTTWVRDGLVYQTIDHTGKVIFAIAGRYNIAPSYGDKFSGEFLYPVELNKLYRTDIEEYLHIKLDLASSLSEDQFERLVDFVNDTSKGVPIAVEGIANALNKGIEIHNVKQYFGDLAKMQLGVREVVAATAHRFLKYCLESEGVSFEELCQKQRERDYIYCFAILRDYASQTAQQRALNAIWRKSVGYQEPLSSVEMVQEYLQTNYSFMFTSDGNIHPEVKLFTRRALREGSIPRGNLRQLNDAALHYFEAKLSAVEGDLSEKAQNPEWRATTLSLLNHLFWDSEKWEQAIRLLVRSYKIATRFAQFQFRSSLLDLITEDESLRMQMPMEYSEVINALLNLNKWISGSPSESVAASELESILFKWLDRETKILDLLGQAKSLSRRKQLSNAITKVRQAEALCINSEFTNERASVYAVIAKEYKVAGLTNKALSWCQRAVDMDDNCLTAHLELGDVYFSQGRLDKAIEEYQRVADLDIKGEAITYVTERLNGIKKVKVRIEQYDFLPNTAPSDARAAARYIAFQGNVRAKIGQISSALEDYRRASKFDPHYYYARVKEGNALRQLGCAKEALLVFKNIESELEQKPKHLSGNAYRQLLASVKDGLATVHLYLTNNVSLAQAHYRHALNLMPNYVNALNGMGRSSLRVRDRSAFESAVYSFEKALKYKSDAYWIYNNLGIAHILLDNEAKAASHFSEATRICRVKLQRPGNRMLYHVHYGLALSAIAQGEAEVSLKSLEEGLNICNAPGIVQGFLSDLQLLKSVHQAAQEIIDLLTSSSADIEADI